MLGRVEVQRRPALSARDVDTRTFGGDVSDQVGQWLETVVLPRSGSSDVSTISDASVPAGGS